MEAHVPPRIDGDPDPSPTANVTTAARTHTPSYRAKTIIRWALVIATVFMVGLLWRRDTLTVSVERGHELGRTFRIGEQLERNWEHDGLNIFTYPDHERPNEGVRFTCNEVFCEATIGYWWPGRRVEIRQVMRDWESYVTQPPSLDACRLLARSTYFEGGLSAFFRPRRATAFSVSPNGGCLLTIP